VLVNAPLTGAKAAAPDYRDHAPLVFYRPGEWKRQVIESTNEGVQHGIFIVDWDGKGPRRSLNRQLQRHRLVRYETDGKWTRTEISKGDPGAWPKSGSSDVAVGHLGKERFLAAIEPWHGNQVAVYRKDGAEWKRSVIDDSLTDGHTIALADLDGDGKDEIVAGFRQGAKSVYIYKLDDAGNWKKEVFGSRRHAGCKLRGGGPKRRRPPRRGVHRSDRLEVVRESVARLLLDPPAQAADQNETAADQCEGHRLGSSC